MSSDNDTPLSRIAAEMARRGVPAGSPAPSAGLGSLGMQNALAAISGRPEVKGLYYVGKVVQLDGYRFVECRFDRCTLRVASHNFELIRCVVDSSTVTTYSPKLAKVLRLFLGRYDWAYGQFDKFFLPVRNPDGTITISDAVP